VVFPDSISNVVCRIGHYISEEYQPIEEKREKLELDILDIEKRSNKTRGKIWHSFRIETEDFSQEKWNFYRYIKQCEKIGYSYGKKSKTFSPEPIFYELIKKFGWCMKPYKNYHGRKRRYSEYHFPKEEYYTLHDDFKHETPD